MATEDLISYPIVFPDRRVGRLMLPADLTPADVGVLRGQLAAYEMLFEAQMPARPALQPAVPAEAPAAPPHPTIARLPSRAGF